MIIHFLLVGLWFLFVKILETGYSLQEKGFFYCRGMGKKQKFEMLVKVLFWDLIISAGFYLSLHNIWEAANK